MQGDDNLARSNTFRTAYSLYPTYLVNSYGPFTVMKFALASLAIALAIIVLPHPGGPYNKIPPPLTSKFMLLNFYCSRRGMMIYWVSSSLIFSRAPTSYSLTLGILAKPSFFKIGWIYLKALLISYKLITFYVFSSTIYVYFLEVILSTHLTAASLNRLIISTATYPAVNRESSFKSYPTLWL